MCVWVVYVVTVQLEEAADTDWCIVTDLQIQQWCIIWYVIISYSFFLQTLTLTGFTNKVMEKRTLLNFMAQVLKQLKGGNSFKEAFYSYLT